LLEVAWRMKKYEFYILKVHGDEKFVDLCWRCMKDEKNTTFFSGYK